MNVIVGCSALVYTPANRAKNTKLEDGESDLPVPHSEDEVTCSVSR